MTAEHLAGFFFVLIAVVLLAFLLLKIYLVSFLSPADRYQVFLRSLLPWRQTVYQRHSRRIFIARSNKINFVAYGIVILLFILSVMLYATIPETIAK